MKRLLNRLMVTEADADTEPERTESTDGSESSSAATETVEWHDVSTGTTGRTESTPGTDPTQEPLAADDSREVGTLTDDQLLGFVLDGMAEPTLVVDGEGQLTHLDSAACQLPTAESVGLSVDSRVSRPSQEATTPPAF